MMMLAIGLASIGLFMALNDVIAVVTANLYLNGFIFFVFCVGIISCFMQVFQLIYSVRWIENFARDPGHSSSSANTCAIGHLAALARSRMQVRHRPRGQFWIPWRHVSKKRVKLLIYCQLAYLSWSIGHILWVGNNGPIPC